MNATQQKMVDKIRDTAIERDGHGDGYEIKQFTVTDHDWGKVSILSVVGHIDDEDTVAEAFARTRRHLFIGPLGGLTLANAARFIKDAEGKTQKTFAANVTGCRALRAPTK